MCAAIEHSGTNVKAAPHPDPNALLYDTWQQWNIALSDFTAVNLAGIKKSILAQVTGTIRSEAARALVTKPGPMPDDIGPGCSQSAKIRVGNARVQRAYFVQALRRHVPYRR